MPLRIIFPEVGEILGWTAMSQNFELLDDLKVWNKDKSKTWDEGLGDEGGNRSFSEVYQWIKRKGKKKS